MPIPFIYIQIGFILVLVALGLVIYAGLNSASANNSTSATLTTISSGCAYEYIQGQLNQSCLFEEIHTATSRCKNYTEGCTSATSCFVRCNDNKTK